MKTRLIAASVLSLGLLAAAGCNTNRDGRITNTRHPGPAIGTGVGVAVGTVAGNVAGAVVGAGEGLAAGAAKPFDNDRRVVRTWRTEVTADGRTIQVPVEIEVDSNNRPYSPVDASAAPTRRGPR